MRWLLGDIVHQTNFGMFLPQLQMFVPVVNGPLVPIVLSSTVIHGTLSVFDVLFVVSRSVTVVFLKTTYFFILIVILLASVNVVRSVLNLFHRTKVLVRTGNIIIVRVIVVFNVVNRILTRRNVLSSLDFHIACVVFVMRVIISLCVLVARILLFPVLIAKKSSPKVGNIIVIVNVSNVFGVLTKF
jgi:hypothetical protein